MLKKISGTVLIIILLSLAIFTYFRFYWEYASGTKAGVINVIQRKGVIFKTWEGKLIQSGFKANIQSNEFDFSVTDDNIARQLERNSGKEANLHYKRYFGGLPWRGMQGYIVDSIYEIRGATPETAVQPKIHD